MDEEATVGELEVGDVEGDEIAGTACEGEVEQEQGVVLDVVEGLVRVGREQDTELDDQR